MKYINVDNNELAFAQQNRPQIAADECLVKVRAIGVNRADLLQRAGKYPAPAGESTILGLEVSGDIIECGSGVDSQLWQKADKIFALVAGGGYAEFVAVKAAQLFKLPQNFTYEQGAACAEVFLTAYQSLFSIAKVKAHSNVLIHAGASGVGSAAIQLAKAKNCYVVATVGSDEKAAACLKLGVDEVLNYHDVDFTEWTKQHLATGFDVIVDVVSGSYLAKNISVAALDSTIVTLSMLGGRFSESIDIAKLLGKRITITGSTLRNRDETYKALLVKNFCIDFYNSLANGFITPVIDSVFSWHEAELAHEKMAKNHTIGKLILTVEHT
jgi:putative PIG3 family NAD(P)H quinone oxidoreductase